VGNDLPISVCKKVTDALRLKREDLGISQNELAQRCDLSRTGLRAIELGINSPTLASLLRISRALGVSLGALISEAE
jgi:transcriptional regulator with XRE-family HTH domain